MKEENLSVIKLKDSLYGNVIQKSDEEVIYCELSYQRDRSSFAGAALKVTNEKNAIVIRECQEIIVEEVSKYEKLYIGCDENYVNALKELFYSQERAYGIDVLFFVYSDVRSSQIIFEELMQQVNKNIDKIMYSK